MSSFKLHQKKTAKQRRQEAKQPKQVVCTRCGSGNGTLTVKSFGLRPHEYQHRNCELDVTRAAINRTVRTIVDQTQPDRYKSPGGRHLFSALKTIFQD